MVYSARIELPSLLNTSMHWKKMVRLKQKQRKVIGECLKDAVIPPLPLIVVLTRIGPRTLDGDNLQGACKYVRDEVAAAVGTDDGSSLYTWVYKQRTGEYGIEIEFFPRTR